MVSSIRGYFGSGASDWTDPARELRLGAGSRRLQPRRGVYRYSRFMIDIGFARSGDVNVAYHVVGDGPVDIVYVQGGWSHLEVSWELPAYRRFCELLGEFARVIRFDKRGMGMSDRVPGATPLDVRMDDIAVVMDAVGSESAALIGESEGGPLSMLFAAAHPERTAGLILMGAEVRERKDEEWPWGESTEEEFEASMARMPEMWGRPGRIMERLTPSQEITPWVRDWMARVQRTPIRRAVKRRSCEWHSTSTSAPSFRPSTRRRW
jgi:pimeloyl-ACP methyl ester carboxylesterase